MSVVKWTGIGIEYFGKLLQTPVIEDAVKGALDAGIEALKTENPKAAARAEASRKAELEAAVEEVRSAPFRAALEKAVVEAEGAVSAMLQAVSGYERPLLVPCGAVEELLATHFAATIGGAPEARRGLSRGLARLVTSAMGEGVAALPRRTGWFSKPEATVVLAPATVTAHHLFRIEPSFGWGARRPRGYLLGFAVMGGGALRAETRPPPAVPANWQAAARGLEQRLGAMPQPRREAFYEGWASFAWTPAGLTGPRERHFLRDLA